MILKHGKLTFEYSKINSYIFMGTNKCCQVHFKNALLKKDIEVDISLEQEKLDQPFWVKYFDVPWIVTNTKYTPDALNYAKSVKMKVTSWDYPFGTSLRDLIEKKKLYPISVLRGVSVKAKEKLFESDIFLIKSLVEMGVDELVQRTGFSKRYLKRIVGEAGAVLGVGKQGLFWVREEFGKGNKIFTFLIIIHHY